MSTPRNDHEQFRRVTPPELRRAHWTKRLPNIAPGILDLLDNLLAAILGAVRRINTRILICLLVPISVLAGIAIGHRVFRQHRAESEVIVSIGDEKITVQDLFHRMELSAGPKALRDIVYERTLLQFARSRNAVPTAQQVQARALRNMSQPGFLDFMREQHITLPDTENSARLELTKENLFSSGVDVSESEVEAYYHAQCDPKTPDAKFYVPQSTRIQVAIMWDKAEADNAYRQWRNGLSFDAVVTSFSKDPSAAEGGMLPPLYHGRSRATSVPGMEEYVSKMNPGQVSPPKLFGGAWWLIQVVSKTPDDVAHFSQVKEQCRLEARVLKGRTHADSIKRDFEAFQKQNNVHVYWGQYYYDLYGKGKPSAFPIEAPADAAVIQSPPAPPIPAH